MIDEIFIVIFGFIIVIVIDYIYSKKKKAHKNKLTNTVHKYHDDMVEYSRETSYKLGFNNDNDGFKRPAELKFKGLSNEEKAKLESSKMKNEKFNDAMKNLIPLKALYLENSFNNKTVRVFIDTRNDTKVVAIDHSAKMEIDLQETFNIAGEFVLINLDKEGDKIKINYVILDNNKIIL